MPQSLAGGTTVFMGRGQTSIFTVGDAREPVTEHGNLSNRPSIHWIRRVPCWSTAPATVQPTFTSADRLVSGRCRVARALTPDDSVTILATRVFGG